MVYRVTAQLKLNRIDIVFFLSSIGRNHYTVTRHLTYFLRWFEILYDASEERCFSHHRRDVLWHDRVKIRQCIFQVGVFQHFGVFKIVFAINSTNF